jgi:hypothetical protein
MSTHPAFALQAAILAALRAPGPVRTLLGGPRVFDAVPPRTPHPHVTLGPVTSRDWSTGSGPGHDHRLTITAHSREPGFAEAAALADALTARLDHAALALDGHTLVLLRFDGAEFRREAGREISRAVLTFRALTETP